MPLASRSYLSNSKFQIGQHDDHRSYSHRTRRAYSLSKSHCTHHNSRSNLNINSKATITRTAPTSKSIFYIVLHITFFFQCTSISILIEWCNIRLGHDEHSTSLFTYATARPRKDGSQHQTRQECADKLRSPVATTASIREV
jgi:hypothetical protein